MAMVLKGDLSGGGISSAIALLEKEGTDSDNLVNSIDEFFTSTADSLTGAAYSEAKAKMQSLVPIIKARKQAGTALAAAIRSACSTMSSYMGEYSKLDDDMIDDLEAQIEDINATISSIEASLNKVDEEGRHYRASDGGQIASLQDQIAKINKELEKLKGLAAADAGAYGQIEGAGSDVLSFSSGVSSFNKSNVSV